MDADLDLLLTTVFVTADDLLPQRRKNAARSVTDAKVVTLCVAQAIMGIPSDRRFLAVAETRLAHLFPRLLKQPGYFKRRRKLADTLEWLMGIFASQSPGFHDDLLLIGSTPVECASSRETVKRSQLADAADYGYCQSRTDPPTHREHLLDLQRPTHPRTPRRPHPPRPQRTSPRPLLPPRSRNLPQPPTRKTKPCTRQLLRLTPPNQPSRGPRRPPPPPSPRGS
jgi:hypothetical protein